MAKQCNIGTIMDHLSPNSFRGSGDSGEHLTPALKDTFLHLSPSYNLPKEEIVLSNHFKGFSTLKRCNNVATKRDLFGTNSGYSHWY